MHKHRIILKNFELEEGENLIEKDIDLKKLAKKQNWNGVDEQEFRRIINELDIKESQEELLWLLKE
ncbi:MAG: hypothetical protein JJU13_11015 [Balneolaceae bacterium]|nr:hypothetical protein [Balneolaceae bacterium]